MTRSYSRVCSKHTKDLKFTVVYDTFADTFADAQSSIAEEGTSDQQQSMWFSRHWVWAIYRWDSINQVLFSMMQLKTKFTRRTAWTAKSWKYGTLIETTNVSIDLDDETAQLGGHDCFEAQRYQLAVWETKLERLLTIVRDFKWPDLFELQLARLAMEDKDDE